MLSDKQFEETVENLSNLFRIYNLVKFKVRYAVCSPGSNSGDNYMSVVKRVKISCNEPKEDEEEDENSLTVIIKRQIASLSRRQLYRCDDAFSNEINAYRFIVPMLRRFSNDNFFPKCIFAGTDDLGVVIILEDLLKSGYSMRNRLVGMELPYCELVMQHLAKLHAASLAAKTLNTAVFLDRCKSISDIVYNKDAQEFYKNIIESSVRESLCSLRNSNAQEEGEGELTGAIEAIEQLETKIFQSMHKGITTIEENERVICHGDLWINNIMFTTGTPPHMVKFYDLQGMRYTSPVFDLLHFIYTSTKRELRDEHTDHLLEIYSATLRENLELQFSDEKAAMEPLLETFSLANIKQTFHRHILYGLAIAMWILPAVTFDAKNLPNLDVISEQNADAKGIKCTQNLTAEYHSRMKDLALEFYENGWLTERQLVV